MKTFTDNANRTWTISINVATIKAVKGILGIDLLSVIDGQLLDKLGNDPIMLGDMLYVLCKQQADAQGVSDEQFGAALAGDAIEAATNAFLQELVDFFPVAKRAALAKMLEKLRTMEARALQLMMDRMENPEMENQINAILHGKSSTNALASVE